MPSDKKPSDEPTSLETDVARLASLIASTTPTTNGGKTGDTQTVQGEEVEELGAEEVEELIRRLEAANGIADGVENKLDEILKHLDGLLGSLESPGEKKETSGPTEPQPDR